MSPPAQKVVVITGACRRIGANVAKILHDRGMNIALHYFQSEKEAQTLKKQLNEVRKKSCITLSGDICDFSLYPKWAGEVVNAWGKIDVLINNASKFYPTPFGKIIDKDWQDLIRVNLQAPLFLTQTFSTFLAKEKGLVINITDIHGEKPMKNYSVYTISKAGLLFLTKQLAKELAPKIRVNAISPSLILWPEGKHNLLSKTKKKSLIEETLLSKKGSSTDIANAVSFLIKDGSYITGQVLNVDGGRILS